MCNMCVCVCRYLSTLRTLTIDTMIELFSCGVASLLVRSLAVRLGSVHGILKSGKFVIRLAANTKHHIFTWPHIPYRYFSASPCIKYCKSAHVEWPYSNRARYIVYRLVFSSDMKSTCSPDHFMGTHVGGYRVTWNFADTNFVCRKMARQTAAEPGQPV